MVTRTHTVFFGASRVSRGSSSASSTSSTVSNQKEEKENTNMSLSFVKKTILPESKVGGPGKPSVSIAENGQLRISATASKVVAGSTFAAVAFDEDKRMFQIVGCTKAPKGLTEADLFKMSIGEKSKQATFSAARLLTYCGYDYKGSGNQSFDAVTDEKNKTVQITLPKGALAKKPVTPRKKKETAPVAPAAPPAPKADEEDED